MKHIVFCADDYGQNEVISQAIIELMKKKCLSATSCLTTSKNWLFYAKNLKPFIEKIDIGLHFNLTEGIPLSDEFSKAHHKFPSLGKLLFKLYLGRVNISLIENELNAQLDQFVKGMGQLPHFIDGHQHILQFPVVRQAVFNVYEKRLRSQGVYLRSVYDPRAFLRFNQSGYLKNVIIQLTGAFTFKRKLEEKNIPHNTAFSGVYDFVDGKQYPEMFPSFLRQNRNGGLLMCHPGLADSDANDLIATSRFQEYQYFSSDDFQRICAQNKVFISRRKESTNV